ncbi:MAG: hypothetical protein U5N85_09210 [Arcicella sp.]|nr:hypothetical protein [Arcicella sp.]
MALLVFQPAAYENYYWTISILQQVGNVFWAMFLFYSIVYFNPSKFWISLLLIFILTFTHGNGLFAFGVGGILLFLQKRHKHLSIWIGFMVIIAIGYFYGYYTAQNSNIAESLSNPTRLIGCFGGFWGIFFKNILNTTNRAILSGLVIFSILFLINIRLFFTSLIPRYFSKFEKSFPEKNQFLFACFLYLTITAGLVALSRSWSSLDAAFQNRYLHNSVIGFVLLYCTLLLYRSEKIKIITFIFGIFFSTVYYVFSWYSNYEFLRIQQQTQQSDAVNYALNGVTTVNEKYFNMNIEGILRQSFKNGVSVLPKGQLRDIITNLDKYKSEKKTSFAIEILKDSILSFNISNSHYRPVYQFTNLNFPHSEQIFLLLKSDKNTFVFATNQRKNRKLDFVKTMDFFTDGFYASITTDALPTGEYSVAILQEEYDNSFHYFTTHYKISNP